MENYAECCTSSDEKCFGTLPQQQLLSLPHGMISSSSVKLDGPANPYQILQVRRDATPSEIRQSYKRLALLNHPGRESSTREEKWRRWQLFNLLAACFETLMDSENRRRYDAACREMERIKLQAGVKGSMFVGGKPVRSSSFGDDSSSQPNKGVSFGGSSLLTYDDRRDTVPMLSQSSSESSSDGEPDHVKEMQSSFCAISAASSVSSPSRKASRSVTAATVTTKGSAVAPSLVDSASSEEDDEAVENHFSESATSRLFGGPLSNLFKARNYEAFSDAYDVFEAVFESQPFPRVSRSELEPHDLKVNTALKSSLLPSPRSPSCWRGDSYVTPDGRSTVYTTSKIVQDRRLTRTETVTRLSNGKSKTHITVTAEALTPVGSSEGINTPSATCLVCTRNVVVDSPSNQPGVCDNVYEFYGNVVQQLDFTREELVEEWRKLLSYDMSFNFAAY